MDNQEYEQMMKYLKRATKAVVYMAIIDTVIAIAELLYVLHL